MRLPNRKGVPSTQARTAHTSTQRQHKPLPQTPSFTPRRTGEKTHHAQPQHHAAPEEDVVEEGPAADPGAALDDDDGHLQHHGAEAVAAELAGDAAHDELVGEGGDEERGERGQRAGEGVPRGRVDVAPEEVVHGDVPLARELEPVAAVPPVGVELAVCEAWARGIVSGSGEGGGEKGGSFWTDGATHV